MSTFEVNQTTKRMSRIFITGSSDGLGLLTAKQLISEGHQVVLHARNQQRANDAIQAAPQAEAVLIADLSSINETVRLANEVNKLGEFDTIIHNAGILNVAPHSKSSDGIPLLFAVNSLAPYLLTSLIQLPKRLIYLCSNMHQQGNASIDILEHITNGKYHPTYSDTKLYDLILAKAIERKSPKTIVNAVDPGWVPTKMGGIDARDDLNKGFETQTWLSVSNDMEALKSGRLFFHKNVVNYHSQADDHTIQNKFIEVCENLSKIKFLKP